MMRPWGVIEVRIAVWFVKIFAYKFTVNKNCFHIYIRCKSTFLVWSVHGHFVCNSVLLGPLSRFESRLGLCIFLYSNLQSRKTVFIYIGAEALGFNKVSTGCQCTAESIEAKPGAWNHFYIQKWSHNFPKCSYSHKDVYM